MLQSFIARYEKSEATSTHKLGKMLPWYLAAITKSLKAKSPTNEWTMKMELPFHMAYECLLVMLEIVFIAAASDVPHPHNRGSYSLFLSVRYLSQMLMSRERLKQKISLSFSPWHLELIAVCDVNIDLFHLLQHWETEQNNVYKFKNTYAFILIPVSCVKKEFALLNMTSGILF